MTTYSIPLPFDPARRLAIADWTVIAAAVVLPWSTSALSIILALWLLAVLPAVSWIDVRRILLVLAAGLPLLLFGLGLAGLCWGDVSWHERLDGISGFVRLAAVPLLIVQFARSERGRYVLLAFLASCVVLLIASGIWAMFPQLPSGSNNFGVPVKSYIIQGLEFTICAAALLDIAVDKLGARQWGWSFGLFGLAAAFVADVLFVATSRTALVVLAALVVLYGFRKSSWRGLAIAGVVGVTIAGAAWIVSPNLRSRVDGIYTETLRYKKQDAITSSGERLAFWQHGVESILRAPVFGHGTGSIRAEFRRAAAGHIGPLGEASSNPHNETLAVGMQLGLLGMIVLWAMWSAQLTFSWSSGLIAWIAIAVVSANVVGSLFNSLVFDFTEGWLYVLGFSVTAGMLLRERGVCAGSGLLAPASKADENPDRECAAEPKRA
jgi:hypothetical protein